MPENAFVGHWNRLTRWSPRGTTPTQPTVPVIQPPKPLPRWSNQPLRLYHGTLEARARSIVSRGVSVAYGKLGTDFGPGFYTTTDPEVAEAWAATLALYRRARRIGVVSAEIDRDSLATLSWLAFAGGDEGAHDFWSFVMHCRARTPHHARSAPAKPLYDAVIGPVAAILKKTSIPDIDQISFHTPAAVAVLNSVQWRFI